MRRLEPRPDTVSNTLTSVLKDNILFTGTDLRYFTPLECFRLQGFPDEHYHKGKKAGVSDSQLYKQAINSVTVHVIRDIATRF